MGRGEKLSNGGTSQAVREDTFLLITLSASPSSYIQGLPKLTQKRNGRSHVRENKRERFKGREKEVFPSGGADGKRGNQKENERGTTLISSVQRLPSTQLQKSPQRSPLRLL